MFVPQIYGSGSRKASRYRCEAGPLCPRPSTTWEWTEPMGFDVAVVGAGLAGSLSASMLGRAGYSVVLIDPHEVYPPDFRCEKIEGGHVDVLRTTGLAGTLLGMATHTDRLWIARFGRLLDVQPFDQFGFRL